MNASDDAIGLYIAALTSDATTLMRRVGFNDRIGRKRLCDLISDLYTTELMAIVQLVRWYEIGLVKPGEIDVPHPVVRMTDLRRRIATSPREYVAWSRGPSVESGAQGGDGTGDGRTDEPISRMVQSRTVSDVGATGFEPATSTSRT
jgi:hypothetical protein